MKLSYIVKKEDNYTNIQEILKCELQLSQRLIRKLKINNKIFLNNAIHSPKSLLHIHDEVSVLIDFEEDSSNIVSIYMPIDILYEDEAYIVINKPAGIPVHPSMEHYTNSLSNGLKYYFDHIGLHKKIRPVNRVDKDTSGIVIFAKNEYIQECLIKQMQSHCFKKEYIAICEGTFESKVGTINAPIARKENSIIERCIHKDGDISITHYEVLNEMHHAVHPYSVVKCILETGRTHQIRVHMQYLNHPLLGDTLYGTASPFINRQALHAHQIQFIHPITKKEVNYVTPLPDDMKYLINE